MNRLGYDRYVAQGGDQGANVTDAMGRSPPTGLLGIHTNLLAAFPPAVAAVLFGGAPVPDGLAHGGASGIRRCGRDLQEDGGYLVENIDAPADGRLRPGGFARRTCRLDARPRRGQLREDREGIPRWAAHGRHHAGERRRQRGAVLADQHRGLGGAHLLGTRTSHHRGHHGPAFPADRPAGGLHGLPRRARPAAEELAGAGLPQPRLFGQAEKGGHFAAWEEPEIFAAEMRAAFKSLR